MQTPERRREYMQEYRLKNRGKLRRQKAVYYQKNKGRWNERRRARDFITKVLVLTHYGGGELACVACRVSDVDVLTIDHIYDNGGEERRRIRSKAGTKFYNYLKRQGLPKGYQTLCANCQLKKEIQRRKSNVQGI